MKWKISKMAPVNEQKLFHGSSAAKKIARKGFDIRHAGTIFLIKLCIKHFIDPKGLLGAGIYFADQSTKSHRYTSLG